MIRDLDDVALAFSMWEQARQAARAAEEQLADISRRPHAATELTRIRREILELRAKADRLMDEAIAALRRHNAGGKAPG